MPRTIRYHASGRFEGYLRTQQHLELKAGDPLPSDDRHLIRVYRGHLYGPCLMEADAFQKIRSDLTLSEVNNIEIGTSEGWPEPRERLFSLETLKLSEVRIEQVNTINDQTYAAISGKAWCSVLEGVFTDPDPLSPDPPLNPGDPGRIDAGGETRKGCLPLPVGPGSLPGCLPSGCLPRSGGCLLWLLRALLAGLLLYWLVTSTQWGKQLVCLFQKWQFEWKTEKLAKQRRDLEDRIERTRPRISQCGMNQDFEGDNRVQAFTYTLGKQSGEVVISYDMFRVPDRMEVIFNGRLVAETQDSAIAEEQFRHFENSGFADETGELRFHYIYDPSKLNELTIRMVPNQEMSTTKWEFKVTCP